MSGKFDIKSLKGLTQDSRAVRPGYLFAALPGTKTDGRTYIAEALKSGANAILLPEGAELKEADQGIAVLRDENPRRRFSLMAAEFFEKQPGYIAAVTGTNGKTSVAFFAWQLWQALGCKGASLGTLGLVMDGRREAGSMTTPDPVALHRTLDELAKEGVTHLAMEASSHGLDQYRLDGVKVRAAAFTNISRDHMDYHKGEEDYFAAKARLFKEIMMEGGMAVLNADAPEYRALKEICKKRKLKIIDYGRRAAGIGLRQIKPLPHGQVMEIEVGGERRETMLPLVGEFQAMNALCALGLVMAEHPQDGPFMRKAVKALETLKPVPGRLQRIEGHPAGVGIYIDYAHTPDALVAVLKALRPHTAGRLLCVFGCGGDRDPGKRPLMGKAVSDHADLAIITDDNPRSEDPAAIRRQVLADAPGAIEIAGRREAIRSAIADLRKGDVLVVAGKGHEQGQIFAERTEPFDDAAETLNAIKTMKG